MERTHMPPDFLIVGLGASAGGIKALKQFFEHVPGDSGIAYVVILHLSPDHESHLAEVLQVSAPIPVTQVEDRVLVEPNHVYVISPNHSLAMQDSYLSVSEITRVEERRAPVDIFFRTLADSHRSRAVCVVLSGTGANGSMGMKRVKEQGGICLVQDPEEAEYSDMPRNSIATTLVDHILPVAQIPAKILAYKQRLPAIALPDELVEPAAAEEQALRDIFHQLRLRTGHDFSNYKRPTVLRRVARRMAVRELPNLADYAAFLQANPEETQSLLKDLLISVTNFFRDREAFEALEKHVVPKLFEGKGRDGQVRVWVAGCATGEEAYSIAILLAEHGAGVPNAPSIQVFATDIDENAIAVAREGAYTLNDAADVSPERLMRFFVKSGERYRIRKELRELVLFARHNVIKDPPFSHLDLVSCRNLLIYMNQTAQQRVLEIMHFALVPGGFMFLGGSESVEGTNDLFAPLDKDAHVFQSRGISSRVALPVLDVSMATRSDRRPESSSEAKSTERERLSPLALHRRMLEQYAPPSLVVDEEYNILHLSEHAGRYLQYGAGEPSHNLLNVVRSELRIDLRAALYQAAEQRVNVEARGIQVQVDDRPAVVNISVRPVLREDDMARGFFLVLFEEAAAGAAVPSDMAIPVTRGDAVHQLEEAVVRVSGQLRETTDRYEIQTEELKASNEELQAMNEELRSSTEELETSREELQSLNEELRTVNQELKIKVQEQVLATDDMQNLINSAEIGTVFLDRSSRIKLFTPKARDIFNLIPADRGRPLTDINSLLIGTNLPEDVDRVLETLGRVEREVRTRDGRWQLMRAVPYRTKDDRIDGVVLTFVDITERKRGEDALLEAKVALEAELNAMTLLHDLSARLLEGGGLEPLLDEVLSAAMKVQGADLGTLQLYEQHTDRLQTVAQRGFAGGVLSSHDVQRRYDATGLAVLQAGERLIIDDTETDRASASSRELAVAIGYRSTIVIPLLGRRGQRLGVLTTHLRVPKPTSSSDSRMLDLYARQAADVIEFSRGQEALRESEDRLRRALEVETVGVLFFTPDGSITHANDAFLRMSGFSREDLEAVGLRGALIAQQGSAEAPKALEEFQTTGRIGAFENEYVRKDGTGWWALVAAERIDQHGGVAFVIDITATQQGREQLRQTEMRLRLIADSVTDYAIFTTDTEGRIDTWSRGAARMFDFTDAEAIGQPIAMLFTPDDQACGAPEEERRQARELGRAADERWHQRKDGSQFYVSGIMAPIFDSRDVLLGYVKVARDLTERRHWEESLQRAHAELEVRVQHRTEALAQANKTLDLELRERRQAEDRIRGLMERLITVQEDERRRIARDLHDHLGQQVAGLSLKIQSLDHSVQSGKGERATVAEAQDLISRLDRDLDFLAWELRPPALDDLGLAVTLGNFVAEWSRNFGIAADFHTRGLGGIRLVYEIETNIYRIAQEALNNIYKHAGARRAGVMLERRDAQVVLIIEDDGAGFAPIGAKLDNRDRGLGLLGMHERAALVGGSLDIETSPETGTTVFVQVPLVVAAAITDDLVGGDF